MPESSIHPGPSPWVVMIVALDVLFVGGFGNAQGGERQGRRSAQRSPHNTARRSVAPKSVEDAGANPHGLAERGISDGCRDASERAESRSGSEVHRKSDGLPWHSYGTPAASKPHKMARLTSRKWLSQQVVRGVEQRIIWTFNPLVDGSIPSRPI
jgi:hypothetical protein